jgi:hypothetical protein
MLKFHVYEKGSLARSVTLRNAYMLGTDGNAMRCEVWFADGMICAEKRETGSAALALQHRVGDLGELTLQTCLLPDREEPYLLNLELARHRLMTLFSKLEDWGMFDLGPEHPVTRRTEKARELFVQALCLQGDDPAKAEQLAEQCLAMALDGSEELALAHSELLLLRRKTSQQQTKHIVGCGVRLDDQHERLRVGLASNFDYLMLPVPWKQLAPEEGEYQWTRSDSWSEWAMQSRAAVIAGPLISFDSWTLPDWLYIWEHDYDTVRDLAYEHIERVVGRYRNAVAGWNVISGLHVNNHFHFNFEQLMDLTRMGLMLVKKLRPQAKALVEIQQPFGEYYSANPRSIPPVMYADIVVQTGVPFDGFSIKFPMGQAQPGQYTRDLMQLSTLLDDFAGYGKPLYVTLAAPSQPVTQMMIADANSAEPVDDNAGFWRQDWTPQVQSHWLEAAFQIAASKPYVEGVGWQQLLDTPDIELPLSGLIGEELQPKPAYRRLTAFRRAMLTPPKQQAGMQQPGKSTTRVSPAAGTSDMLEPLSRDPDPDYPASDSRKPGKSTL